MSMIEVDISNIWGDISLPDLLGMEKDVFLGHQALTEGEIPGWMQLPEADEISGILSAAEEIREFSDILVVIGDSAARGTVELLEKSEMQVIFLRGSLSTRSRNALLRQLEGKSFSLCICPNRPFWDDLALRELKWLLERRFGTDEAHSRIHEDPQGLIAMAAAGVDIRALLSGMEQAREEMDLRSYDNPAWLYAAARRLMVKKGRNAELLIHAEPEFAALGDWWKGLFGGEILPVCIQLPGELKSWEGVSRFETTLRFTEPEKQVVIGQSLQDPQGLNFLAGQTLAQVEDTAWETALEAHTDMGVPVVGIQCGEISEQTLGELLWFFRLSNALYGALAGTPGAGDYESALLRQLEKQ